jgi:hypothetical protein
MTIQPTSASFYVARLQPLVAALIGGCFIALDLLYWEGGFPGLVSWLAQGPLHVIVAIIIGLLAAALTLWGLYWALTPIPLLRLTAAGLTYAPSPFRRISVAWTDVATLTTEVSTPLPPTAPPEPAGTPAAPPKTGRNAIVTLTIQRTSGPTLILDLAPAAVRTTADNLIRALQTYHEVHWAA